MSNEKFYTDYPFTRLGDISGKKAPVREIMTREMLSRFNETLGEKE